MEFSIQAWSPYLKKDIACLEGVQRIVTILVHSLTNNSYEERLQHLHLYSLKTRSLRDLIETFKILTEREDADKKQFFTLSTSNNLRSHNLELFKNPGHAFNYDNISLVKGYLALGIRCQEMHHPSTCLRILEDVSYRQLTSK